MCVLDHLAALLAVAMSYGGGGRESSAGRYKVRGSRTPYSRKGGNRKSWSQGCRTGGRGGGGASGARRSEVLRDESGRSSLNQELLSGTAKESVVTPVGDESSPGGVRKAPAGAGKTPAGAGKTPQTTGKAEGAPAGAENTPVGAENTPAGAGKTPASSEGTPGTAEDSKLQTKLPLLSDSSPANTPVKVPVKVKDLVTPRSEKKGSVKCRLFVGNISRDTSEAEVKDMFSVYGEVCEVFVPRDKSFGFVRMVSSMKQCVCVCVCVCVCGGGWVGACARRGMCVCVCKDACACVTSILKYRIKTAIRRNETQAHAGVLCFILIGDLWLGNENFTMIYLTQSI